MWVDWVINTSGRGLWSRGQRREVVITKMKLAYVSDEGDYGELRAYFTKKTWDVKKHGLIYTDPMFLRQFRDSLTMFAFPGAGVDYTEQGMQGNNYVSLGVGKRFINVWLKLGEKIAA